MKYADVIYSLNKFVHDNIETPYSLHVNYTNMLDEDLMTGDVDELVQVFFLNLTSPYQTTNPGTNVRFGIYTSTVKDPTRRRLFQIADIVKTAVGSITNIPFYDFSTVTSADDTPVDTGKTIPFVWMETIPVTLTTDLNYNIMYLDYRLFVSELCLEMDEETGATNVLGSVGENKHG